MSYTINHYSGRPLTVVSDGSVDQTTSLTLIGRDYAGYGVFLNENFVYLLENFASSGTGPANPVAGQLWWDTANNILRVWSGTSWKISTGATASDFSSPPGDLSGLGGDLWFDKTNSQLKVWSGGSWITVGPANTGATPNTFVQPALMTSIAGPSYVVIQTIISGTLYSVFSNTNFTVDPAVYPGFQNIVQGLNFTNVGSTTSVPVLGLNTQSTNPIGGTLVQRDAAGSIQVNNITGLGDFTTRGALTATSLNVSNFVGNVIGNVIASNLTVTGSGTLNGNPIATYGAGGFGTFANIQISNSLIPTTSNSVNLGDTTHWWNNIYGQAVHALYADLAERFHADAEYPAGTVVEMGGPNEITKVVDELSDKVFGVISTNAAYLMNSSAGDNATHPPIAMSGRVPVRAVGLINKGDRLVSAGNGLARAGQTSELTPWNVIGRSLVNKPDSGEGTIEAIVKINS
jgi:hypothetical protein